MWTTIRDRLLASIPLLLVVTLLSFVLNSLSPSDLARTILGADGTKEQYLALRQDMGLAPVILGVGSHDFLYRDNVAYAASLRAAGYPATAIIGAVLPRSEALESTTIQLKTNAQASA